MKIKFCGAAEGVTGSCHLVTAGTGESPVRILLDCGELQGGKTAEERNRESFPFDPADVDFVILSHAHIDHCGRLPLLVKRGYEGRIFCTEATADLLGIMLRDGAHIHEKEAEWKTRKALRAGKPPAEPLYTTADAEEALRHLAPVRYGEVVEAAGGARFVFKDAGHILGSAVVELWAADATGERKIVFSGDLGQSGRPMLEDPTLIESADCVIMESTYGNRNHEYRENSDKTLADIFIDTSERGGTIVIPSFAVGRAQDLIYELNELYENDPYYSKKLKDVNIYLDSPMAIDATEVFKRNAMLFDKEYKEKVESGDDPLDFMNMQFTKSTDESKALNESDEPKVIVSASGMCEAGRIRHHLKHHLWRGRDAVVFVGYQAAGTLGRYILDGAKTVKLFGEEIYVNARIYDLQGFSAHADHDGLMAWAGGFKRKPEHFFLVHGELQAKKDLARDIEEEIGIRPTVVERISEFAI
ncbi:MAG: MBL fold metallo-hydrolase [Clostridiales Family XIII bacterium]|jgi:metallo-beta-lactamase family protein|nr:MBL fold metallo-hydrolase [Clostridiales Family XIII bacterium]